MMISERLWQGFCGTDSASAVNFYWELFVDISLVAGSWFLPRVFFQSPNSRGVVQFALLYFSLINGWFLYAHHYASRFREVSRMHWLLVWMFNLAIVYSVNHATFESYRQFSMGMIYMRLATFVMLTRVGCYVERAQPISSLLAVFIGDAILCYALSAASDVESAAILWGFVAITELHVDLFLAVGLRGNLQLPYQLESTMDRFDAVMLAPMGAIAVNSFCRAATDEEILNAFSSMALMTFFGTLYFAFKEPAITNMRQRSPVEKASMLILMKLLGFFLWTICACLLVESDINIQSYVTDLMGWMVGSALVCFLNIRIIAGRPHDFVEVIWILLLTIPFLLKCFIQDSTPFVSSSIYAIIVLILTVVELWCKFGTVEIATVLTTTTTMANVTILDSTSGNTATTSAVLVAPSASYTPTEELPLITIGTVDLYTNGA